LGDALLSECFSAQLRCLRGSNSDERLEIRAKVGKTCKKKLENVAPAAFTNHGTEQEFHPPA